MMITIIKLLIGICLTLLEAYNKPETINDYKPLGYTASITEDPVKTKAFEILTNKCNVCHEQRNRRRVFTENNMNNWSNDVYKQVFIKKRMPKGKKIKLTSEEYQDLLTWISSLKNNQNGNQL
ncbi:hypothetical protein ACFQZJ_02385 [Maribacter chungangensis]|uniref:Haem-binding domain-containing protein n=1 Tax=Maribacter chungangensis TaxID=1069117 RepID=A0ABW3AZ38_9FLAO